MLLVPSVQVATLALGVAVLIFNLTSGFVSSSLQSVLSTPIRGMGVAMLMLAVNLIGGGGGGGAGPLLEGMMSNYLVPLCGADGLRYSLVAGIGGLTFLDFVESLSPRAGIMNIATVINNMSESCQKP